MEVYLEIIKNNYIYFVIASIVLIFSLIGYISKNYKKKNKKEVINSANLQIDTLEDTK